MDKEKDLIFGLDIGTRTVIGVLGYLENDQFVVLDTEKLQHETRSMIDGQIHNISKVTEIVEKIKKSLEERNSIKLEKVVIAAAGRALKTYNVKINNKFDEEKNIVKGNVRMLELDGVKKATEILEDENKNSETKYFCVGHSIVSYYLDDHKIKKLEGHRGTKIGAEVIATFLPKIVVDSLNNVMANAGLEVLNLTLEPIAAINVAIPEDLRLLNLALVDIGAGTSDIALTKNGSVVAYGMIPSAGDEITEKIVQEFLVDFNTAEKIKVDIEKNDVLEFIDVLGNKQKTKKEKVVEVIDEAVRKLAEEIAEKLLEMNIGKEPKAIFCVGGGSKVYDLEKKISEQLGIPIERVVVRGNELIKNVDLTNCKLEGPSIVTPLGICVAAIEQFGLDFINVVINGEKTKLINTQNTTVLEAAMVKKFNHKNLIARRGKNINFILDGKKIKVHGRHGKAAQILVNNEKASLDTPIFEEDEIQILSATIGEDAEAYIYDYIDQNSIKNIRLNGRSIKIKPNVSINGSLVDLDAKISDGDIVESIEIKNIRDLVIQMNIDTVGKKVFVNNQEVKFDYEFISGDNIEIK